MIKNFALELIKPTNLPQTQANSSTIHTLTNIAFAIIASIAVLIMVIAGLRYIFSQGDPNMIAESKRAIIYAAVGLAVAFLAANIVNAALGWF